ncbi:MAG: DUF1836 domain-containing protein [Clostridium sp.]
MKKEEILKLSETLGLEKNIELDEIPEIDLYMDQVIQLFESKYASVKRNDEEKLLTKTMINNYAKAKLFMPINKKKYSKEHLIMMSFIYNLKGVLSINDIKLSLDNIVKAYENGEEYELRELYSSYLSQCKNDLNDFNKDIENKVEKINNASTKDYEQKLLLLSSFINMSNMYRRMGEKLIDEFLNLDGEDK